MQKHGSPGQPPFTHELDDIGAYGTGTFATRLVWWIPARPVVEPAGRSTWIGSLGSERCDIVWRAPSQGRSHETTRSLGVKFSYRQILASAVGAVLAAVIASVFGVKGTIVGVAIGSIVATTGTGLAFKSIEKTNKAVKQVVVRAPESSLLRRLGGTDAAGLTEATPLESSASTEETGTSAAAAPEGVTNADTYAPAVTQQLTASSRDPDGPGPDAPGPVDPAESQSVTVRWPVVVLAVFGVFVVSLLFVTVVELVTGRPLADLFGHGGGGTTVERNFENPTTTLPPPTTTTTSTTTSTSSTTSTSTTTTTTTPNSSTTTSVGGSATSTTGVGSTATTSPSSATTTTTVPGTKSP